MLPPKIVGVFSKLQRLEKIGDVYLNQVSSGVPAMTLAPMTVLLIRLLTNRYFVDTIIFCCCKFTLTHARYLILRGFNSNVLVTVSR